MAAEADREKFLDIILVESKRMTRIIGDIIAIIYNSWNSGDRWDTEEGLNITDIG